MKTCLCSRFIFFSFFLCFGKQNLEPVFETLGDPVLVCLLLLWSKHSNQRQLSREKGLSGLHFQELWPSLASAQLSWLLRTSCLGIVLPSACGPLLYQLAIRKILHRCVHGPIWSRQPHPKVLLGLCQAGIQTNQGRSCIHLPYSYRRVSPGHVHSCLREKFSISLTLPTYFFLIISCLNFPTCYWWHSWLDVEPRAC